MLKQSRNIYSCIWNETNLWFTLHLSYSHLSFTVLFKIFLLALLWTKLLTGAVPKPFLKQETGLKGCHPSALWEAGHQWIILCFPFWAGCPCEANKWCWRAHMCSPNLEAQQSCAGQMFFATFHFSSSPPSPVPNLCFSAVGKGFVDRGIIA